LLKDAQAIHHRHGGFGKMDSSPLDENASQVIYYSLGGFWKFAMDLAWQNLSSHFIFPPSFNPNDSYEEVTERSRSTGDIKI
jgi:hypothetical protein